MSVRVLSAVWQMACDSHAEKLVLLALADNCNDAGHCWPSITTIARKCDLCRRAVFYQILSLEKKGLLSIHKEPGRSNRYSLTIPVKADPCTPCTSAPDAPPPVHAVHQRGCTPCTTPVHAVHPNRQEPSTKPSGEPGGPPKKELLKGAERVSADKELERVIDGMKSIRNSYGDHQTWTPRDTKEYNLLVDRKKELKALLGVKR